MERCNYVGQNWCGNFWMEKLSKLRLKIIIYIIGWNTFTGAYSEDSIKCFVVSYLVVKLSLADSTDYINFHSLLSDR